MVGEAFDTQLVCIDVAAVHTRLTHLVLIGRTSSAVCTLFTILWGCGVVVSLGGTPPQVTWSAFPPASVHTALQSQKLLLQILRLLQQAILALVLLTQCFDGSQMLQFSLLHCLSESVPQATAAFVQSISTGYCSHQLSLKVLVKQALLFD